MKVRVRIQRAARFKILLGSISPQMRLSGYSVKISRLVLAVLSSTVLSLGFLSFNGRAADAPCKQHPCGKPTTWEEFNVFTLKIAPRDRPGEYSSWHGQFDKGSEDVQVEVEMSDDSATKSGKALMIGGRVLAIQGNIFDSRDEVNVPFGALLQYQFLLRLLGAALPDGPATLKGVRKIDYSKQKTGVRQSPEDIPPPWRVKGTVKAEVPGVVEGAAK